MTVQDFMTLPTEIRRKRACGPNLLTEAQLRSAESIASQLPHLKVERAFFKVHGERYVTPGSLVQFVVKARMIPPGTADVPPVSDKALEEPDKPPKQQADEEANQKRIAPPLAHSPFFARDHSPRWHLFLADGKQGKMAVPPATFTTFDKPLFDEDGKPTLNVQTLSMTFGAPPQPGTYTFLMHLVCDSYLGLDTMMNVKMVVDDASKAEAIEDEGEISEPEAGKIDQLSLKPKSISLTSSQIRSQDRCRLCAVGRKSWKTMSQMEATPKAKTEMMIRVRRTRTLILTRIKAIFSGLCIWRRSGSPE